MTLPKSPKGSQINNSINLVSTDGEKIFNSGKPEPFNGWHDILGQVVQRGVGSNDPVWEDISGSDFYAYRFNLGDEVWMQFHFPHDYILGTDVYIHVHWLPDGTNANSVKWQFDYTWAKGHNQAAFNMTGTTITAEQTVGGTAYQHYVTESDAISNAAFEPDGILMVRVSRITNGGTNNTDNIYMLTSDIHYESDNKATLNRAPDFYS